MLSKLACVVIAVSAVAPAVHAQSPTGRITMAAGSATDVNGVASSAITIAPSVTYRADASSLLSLSANGTRFTTGAWSAAGGAALSSRASSNGPFTLTFDGAASYTGTSYKTSFAALDALPAVEASAGAFRAYVGAHGSLAHTALTTQIAGPPIGGFNERSTAVSRTGATLVAGAGYGWSTSNAERIDLNVREERGRVADSMQVDHAFTIAFSNDAASIGGSLGARKRGVDQRSTIDDQRLFLSLRVALSVSLDLSGGKYGSNPMTGAAAGTYANAGLSISVGGPRVAALPRAAGAPSAPSGMTRLSIKATDAKRVEVAGDFTKWELVPARRANNGVWYVDLRIPPGEYRYAFRVDGGAWQVPDGVRQAEDEFGSRTAWLVVPTTTRRDSSR